MLKWSHNNVKSQRFSKDKKARISMGHLSFFVMSLAIHWTFAWFTYAEEQTEHNQAIELSGYLNQTLRDTMENWQSEFLQLMWQVGGYRFYYMWDHHNPKKASKG
jgi:hypothetical protein